MVFISWTSFWPAFVTALIATLKVFAIGSAGFVLVRRKWIAEEGLPVLGQLVAYLTLPCLIFYRFASKFDPVVFPDWWKYTLIGTGITIFGLLLGKLVALRHGNNEEATMLVGFQNAGFFVLPMLQALLPAQENQRASLLLFVLIIPFNATLWLVGSWLLLKRRDFDVRTILTPPFVATVSSLMIYGLCHDWMHQWDNTLLMQVLFGNEQAGGTPGAVQQIGDLTVPLATIALGGSIAVNLRGRIEYKRAAVEVTLMRLAIVPLLGYFTIPLMEHWLGHTDHAVGLLLMLQFASPPAIALTVFAQQHDYPMRIIPPASLLSYIVCLLTIPFFVALVLK
ncbi:MAG: AEC family transporter [Abitibacteriaceae bacterium]|nr:AEC family transporter [Abditibacteriaceae bacterium]